MHPTAALPRRVVLAPSGAGAAFGPGLVARERLVRRLMEARELPLAVLAAPAGYGKTTTLLEWAQHDERPFAWIALDRAADDPKQLLAAVASATGSLTRHGRAFVLVIDDVHVLRSAAAGEALKAMVARPPAGAQVVLASRSEPQVHLGRLRAHREVLELGPRDFVMTHEEAAALLELARVELGPAEVDALVQRTEGWPAGLYLAALSLREQPDAAAAMRFGGDDRVVSAYIADSLLFDLSTEEVTFLRRASVLDRLSGPLCDAVLGRSGSAAMLRDLARANVLLVPVDRIDRWYRYHGLLAQMLRAELRRDEPALEPELHRRASRWHADQKDFDAAIEHAIAASDLGLAGDLLWANILRYAPQGKHGPAVRWLAKLTDEQTAGHPPLALVAAAVHLAGGDRDLAEHWTAAAARSLRGAPETTLTASLEAGVATMRAAIARDGVVRMRDDAARAYALSGDESPWRSTDRLLEGTACHLLGARERAQALLEEGSRRSVVAAPTVNALCLAQLALLAVERGDWTLGAELATRARLRVGRLHLDRYPTMSLVLAVAAMTQARLGHLEAAKNDSGEARRLLAAMDDFAPWYVAEAGIVLSRAALRLSDVVGARALLDRAAGALRGAPDAPVLRTWLDDARARVEAYSASAAIAPDSLTTAELRILRLLPTHLSFREIGSRLYVSPNTVKTQAQAVYRKLDASSRSEAVVRARDRGLLDG